MTCRPAGANWLFVDMNSYFASVEQELRPELRGRPVGIVPQMCDNTVCIAASYQAKTYGVKTGTTLEDAKALCPHIVLVEARPYLYVEFHQRIITAIEKCIPITSIMSCDEFACCLIGRERDLKHATDIAYNVKQAIRDIGRTLRCSIGLAPNRLLAKVAAEMQKPDGLMILEREHLPDALFSLEPSDIPGIGERMNERLRKAGIESMKQLCATERAQMHAIWGSVLGDRMYFWLHGEDFITPMTEKTKTIGHQHVLPPESRTRDKARIIALKMLHSCAQRLRKQKLWAAGIGVLIEFYRPDGSFEAHLGIEECGDTITLQERFGLLWRRCPSGTPYTIAVRLYNLTETHKEDLFTEETIAMRNRLSSTIDKVNRHYGHNTIYLGSIHHARESAPARIPFGAPPDLEEF